MKIYSVFDKKFKKYGRVIDDDFSDLLEVLTTKPCPSNVVYVASDKDLEQKASFNNIKENYFGGMPIQLGYCNGHNNTLNCLEYHLDSEINLSPDEFILLLGLRSQIFDGKFNTKNVVAFKVPKGIAVEVFSTSLHYAPISVNKNGFRMLVCLPKGTNTEPLKSKKEPMLWATNKWLIAHPESNEAKEGAYVGLIGKNIKI